MLLRLGAHADRPRAFFRDPWNVFDLAVALCAFLPFARENTTVLRLLRLARVLRTARFLPQLRIVLVAVGRSLPGTVSFLLVGALVLYVYAVDEEVRQRAGADPRADAGPRVEAEPPGAGAPDCAEPELRARIATATTPRPERHVSGVASRRPIPAGTGRCPVVRGHMA